MNNVNLGHPPVTGSMVVLRFLTEARAALPDGLELEMCPSRHNSDAYLDSFHRRATSSRRSELRARNPASERRLVRTHGQVPDARAVSHQHVLA
jgi:hypothetical protein